jgi:hypothetical protein
LCFVGSRDMCCHCDEITLVVFDGASMMSFDVCVIIIKLGNYESIGC